MEPRALSEIRAIVARAIGLAPADLADDCDLLTTFASDWNDIRGAITEIDQRYQVDIPLAELGEEPTIQLIYQALARRIH